MSNIAPTAEAIRSNVKAVLNGLRHPTGSDAEYEASVSREISDFYFDYLPGSFTERQLDGLRDDEIIQLWLEFKAGIPFNDEWWGRRLDELRTDQMQEITRILM